jgi:hypothetical protein
VVKVLILIQPQLSLFQQLASDHILQESNLNTGRKIMESNNLFRNGIPQFDGQNGLKYEMWSNVMQFFLQAQWYDVWYSFVTGYTISRKPNTAAKKELKRNNKIAMDFIIEGLLDLVKFKVGQCSLSKEIWDKPHNFYS